MGSAIICKGAFNRLGFGLSNGLRLNRSFGNIFGNKLDSFLFGCFFAKEENDYLDRLRGSGGAQEVTDAFFTIWTLKEAYAKYTGKGMSEGFSGFSVMPSVLGEGEDTIGGSILQSGRYGKLGKDCFWAAFSGKDGCGKAPEVEVIEILPEHLFLP